MLLLLQVIHIMVCIVLILFILLQTGKGSDLGAMLGGGGANTLFGATGASSFLSKLTTYSAVIFVGTCLSLAYLSSHVGGVSGTGTSIMPDTTVPAGIPAGELTPGTANTPPADSDDAVDVSDEPTTDQPEAAPPAVEGETDKAAAVEKAAPKTEVPATKVEKSTDKPADGAQ